MPSVQVINKQTHQATELNLNAFNSMTLQNPSVIKLQVDPKDVDKILIQDKDLVIQLKNGEVLVIKDYVLIDNSLVFVGNNGQLNWVQFSDANAAVVTSQQTQIDDLDPLLYPTALASSGVWAAAAAVALGIGVLSNDSDDSSLDLNNESASTSSASELSSTSSLTNTLYATAETTSYSGSSTTNSTETESVEDSQTIVDYQLAGDTAITVDLSDSSAQDTGFGVASFVNIDGVAGASGNDTFTSNTEDNSFEGRGGDDTFYINDGGSVSLIYNLLDSADATGGNGTDTAYGFNVASVESSDDADVIDLADLLIDYTGDAEPASYQNGTATLASDAEIRDYLSVDVSGEDTVISIDRDGAGTEYGFEQILVLKGVDTSLEELLANHQIIIG